MDGLEAIGKIIEINKDIPIIINSAYSTYKDDFMSWAADAYVVKSYDLDSLKSTIRDVLGKKKLKNYYDNLTKLREKDDKQFLDLFKSIKE